MRLVCGFGQTPGGQAGTTAQRMDEVRQVLSCLRKSMMSLVISFLISTIDNMTVSEGITHHLVPSMFFSKPCSGAVFACLIFAV